MNNEYLIQSAREARKLAYTPYSNFAVGAALLASDGRVFTGCNVENVSFGLTMCAERVALGVAVAAGATSFDVVAVVSDSKEPVMPCGACRQVMAELLQPSAEIMVEGVGVFTLDDLLPNAFRLGAR
jgi:cytidine deaminase